MFAISPRPRRADDASTPWHQALAVPIDFAWTAEQRELQLASRRFARTVLSEVGPATRHLTSPFARFVATRSTRRWSRPGEALVEAGFAGTVALVGVFGTALMRAAFEFALDFAKTQTRGGELPIIEHQAVGCAVADAKTAIEASRLRVRQLHELVRGAGYDALAACGAAAS